MMITTLSPKGQTTLPAEVLRAWGLKPGARLHHRFEGRSLVIDPIDDVMTAFGSLKSAIPKKSIKEETEDAETAMAEDAINSTRDA